MFRKYVILAVCAALVITLIHAPDSCGKTRPTKYFDSKIWVRIDEIEGHGWGEAAIVKPPKEPQVDHIIKIDAPGDHHPRYLLLSFWYRELRDLFCDMTRFCRNEKLGNNRIGAND